MLLPASTFAPFGASLSSAIHSSCFGCLHLNDQCRTISEIYHDGNVIGCHSFNVEFNLQARKASVLKSIFLQLNFNFLVLRKLKDNSESGNKVFLMKILKLIHFRTYQIIFIMLFPSRQGGGDIQIHPFCTPSKAIFWQEASIKQSVDFSEFGIYLVNVQFFP